MIAGKPSTSYILRDPVTDSYAGIGKDHIMALGFDQSPTATGIVLGPCSPAGGSQVRLAKTCENEAEIITYLVEIANVYSGIDLICREEGFGLAGLQIKDMGGFVRGVCMMLWPEAFHVELNCKTWRSMVHRHSNGSTSYWKKVSLAWAQADCDLITDHHQADARGIMAAGGQMWFDGKFK